MGNAGVLAGLRILGRGGGDGNSLGLGSSSGVVVFDDGAWIGSARDSPLDSVTLRCSVGMLVSEDSMLRSARVHLAAASVAGATEKRSPICTVALLSVL
jgi:hypothetical protein